MMTHGKHLDILSNNMTNISTAGYKADQFTQTTFEEVMWQRVGNRSKNYVDIGTQSYITVPDQLYTDYTQGAPQETYLPLDFCIYGEGFFQIETADGNTCYTRNGNFSLDDDGYLWLSDKGRVLDVNGNPIQLGTDKIITDDLGSIYSQDGNYLGKIGVWTFEDNGTLNKDDQGFFTAEGQGQLTDVVIYNGYLEQSNDDMAEMLTELISTQRAYQSAAEALQIYDSVMTKATTEVGRL